MLGGQAWRREEEGNEVKRRAGGRALRGWVETESIRQKEGNRTRVAVLLVGGGGRWSKALRGCTAMRGSWERKREEEGNGKRNPRKHGSGSNRRVEEGSERRERGGGATRRNTGGGSEGSWTGWGWERR